MREQQGLFGGARMQMDETIRLTKVAHPPYLNVPAPFGDNEFPSRAAALVAALKVAPCA